MNILLFPLAISLVDSPLKTFSLGCLPVNSAGGIGIITLFCSYDEFLLLGIMTMFAVGGFKFLTGMLFSFFLS